MNPAPEEAAAYRMVRIARGEQTDEFDPSIEGVDAITRTPAPIPEDLVPEVRAAARRCEVSLRVSR